MANRAALIAPTVGRSVKNGTPAHKSVSSAKAAGLHYADPESPGLSRVRKGRGFVYRTAKGKPVRDVRTLSRIHGLVLPPAWTDVWISPDPRGHLQATGRDARGRKQYRYHPLWTAERDSSTDINEYLREISGGEFTAKDFRRWGGTLSAAKELDGFDPPASETAGKRAIVEAIDRVAETLGNTRSVCRKCYVHPAVLAAFQAGLTIGGVSRKRASKGLREAEAKLVALLLRMDQKKAA